MIQRLPWLKTFALLIKHFDQGQRNALLPALAQAEREDIRKLSAYTEGTAGCLDEVGLCHARKAHDGLASA